MLHNHNQQQQPPTRADLAPYEARLHHFKVTELQAILTHWKLQKLGKKNELQARCVELLRTPQYSRQVMEKIRELEARVNGRATPYPLPTNMNANAYQQQQQSMYNRPNGGLSYNNYGGMPTLNSMAGMNSMHSMQQHQQSQANFTPKPAKNLTPQPLPFYDEVYTLLAPQELPASSHGNKINAQVLLTFALQSNHQMQLQTRADVFPRHEVQMRFFNATGDILHIEQPDDFPLNCAVKINESPVALPSVIPTNKPNVEPKRPSRPVNLTSYVTGQPKDKIHRVKIDWSADKRTWAVAIYVVLRVDSNILRERVKSSPSYELPYETTEATIRKRLGGDDDDVAMDALKISLLCPLGKTRMTVAARSRDCTHLQCFDLDLYLQMNEKRPTWKCCVCSNSAPFHKLIIDQYFMKMLKELGPAVTDVELLKDGSFRVIAEDDICDLSDDDDCGVVKPKPPPVLGGSAAAPAAASAAAAAASSSSKKDVAGAGDDIITISDDDEDEMSLRAAIRASMPSTAPGELPRTPVNHLSKGAPSGSLDNSIICLSDDDSPPRASSSSGNANKNSGTPSSSSSAAGAAAPSAAATIFRSSSSSTTTVPASSTTTSAAGAAAGYGGGRPAATNLADALNQAGLRPNAPSSLHIAGGSTGPMSAAIAVSNAHQSLFNWAQQQQQQQPQSAPPMMNQWNAMGYGQQMGAYGGGYFPTMQQQQQAAAAQQAAAQQFAMGGYAGQWGQQQPGGYGQQGGVIRRPDDQSR